MDKNRQAYLDNLKLYVVVLAVIMHLAMAYGGLGDWYYKEQGLIGGVPLVIYNFFQLFTQSYFLGIMFIITGYFVPASYEKKGPAKFIKDRAIRLGIPALAYMLAVSPFISGVLLGGGAFEPAAYLRYVLSFEFLGRSGPLWFAVAALAFSLAYAAYAGCAGRAAGAGRAGHAGRAAGAGHAGRAGRAASDGRAFPSTPIIIGFVLLMGACTFITRIAQPMGAKAMGIPLCFIPQHALLFAVGASCRRNGWLDKLVYAKGRRWLVFGLAFGALAWLAILVATGASGSGFETLLGGAGWQSAAYAIWESAVSVSMAIGLLALFKEKLDMQNRLAGAMSKSAFAVFVFHPPVIVALTLLFRPFDAPLATKFLILSMPSVLSCFLFANFVIGKIPIIKKLFM